MSSPGWERVLWRSVGPRGLLHFAQSGFQVPALLSNLDIQTLGRAIYFSEKRSVAEQFSWPDTPIVFECQLDDHARVMGEYQIPKGVERPDHIEKFVRDRGFHALKVEGGDWNEVAVYDPRVVRLIRIHFYLETAETVVNPPY